MTGMGAFCARDGDVEIAAPANSARTSRRLMRPDFLPQAIALGSVLVMHSPMASALCRIERDAKDRHGFVITLEVTGPKSFHGTFVADIFGHFGVQEDFLVGCRCAEARCEIHHPADGSIVEAVFVSDASNRRRSAGEPNPESN